MNLEFFITSILLGIGLAMDATCVSMTNGLREPNIKLPKVLLIAFFFGFFQGAMPLIGYFCGHALLKYIEKFIPWIALILLVFLGSKILFDVYKEKKNSSSEEKLPTVIKLTIGALFVQAIATSIDALSVGLTFSDYKVSHAIVCSLIIALCTFIICVPAVYIGKKFGTLLESKAQILGAIVLIGIGIWIFINGMFL
ncbi:MAG: manganese efflux pump MntP family protein [Anaeroplasmataceae bacterium]